VARAREVPDFDCGEPFHAAAARVVASRAEEVFDHSKGVLDCGDIERLHDMRVATRRLRAALEVFEPCFPAKRWRKASKRVRALADALGDRRDRDVGIDFLAGLSGQLPGPDRGRLEHLVEELRIEQSHANERLRPLVSTKRLRKLRRRLAELTEAARP
jgi:CHAD domain-containing protein